MKLVEATLRAILDALAATGGAFDPAATFVGVYSAIADHGQDTVLADVTEGTGALAVRKAVTTWGADVRLSDGRWARQGPAMPFGVASAAEAQSVVGFFLADALTAGNLLGWVPLAQSVPLEDEFSEVSIVVRLTVDPDGRWDASVMWNG